MKDRHSDAIVLVGLNAEAAAEASILRRLGNKVTLIANGTRSASIKIDGRDFDLTSAAGVGGFLRYLRVPETAQDIVRKAFQEVDRDIGDELGQLAIAWALAERRGPIPGRMVISGEHVGSGMFFSRTNPGILRVSDLATLAGAFPKVAHAIEDLHTSACQSANEVLKWPRIFPHLKTIWAYAGSAPGTHNGAGRHLALWDRATRGRAKTIDRLVAKGTRKGSSVVIWTPLGGLVTGDVSDLASVRAQLAAGNATFESFFEGDSVVTDPQAGPLRDYYNWLQEALRHDDLPGLERLNVERRRDAAVRLLFYEARIRGRFASAYRSLIAGGYAAVNLPVPDFARLSRKDAVNAIGTFQSKADERRHDAAEALRPPLVEGLLQLSSRYIPENWI